MHGRPRNAPAVADLAAYAAKSAKLRDLQCLLLQNHHNKLYTKEAVQSSGELLEINPEVYTAWNYRKLALQHNLNGVADPGVVKSLVDEELRIVEMALRKNPKAYGAWHHRKWVLNLGLCDVNFDREFYLLNQLLKDDHRNFHGWNYRRFIAKLKNVPEVEELKFTMDMINTNFSNYSAWHNRSALLSRLLKQKTEGFDVKENIVTEEYDLVQQALFTDPSDQSGWFYHLWLLDQTVNQGIPLLISSWPSHGSDWVLSSYASCFKLCSSSFHNLQYSLPGGSLPIILYFNQSVKGVNSSSVIVSSKFAQNEDLIWCPLSVTKSREAYCWVTYLKILDGKFSNEVSSTVEVSIGNSCGITSSSGCHYSLPLQCKFTITMKSTSREQTEESTELVSWNKYKDFDYEDANEISFDKLNITMNDDSQVPKWILDTLSNEIEHFRELSEENCKYGKLTLARLLLAQDAMTSLEDPLMRKRNHHVEVLELFDDLVKLDPSHARYYKDERSLVTINQETLHKHRKHLLQSYEGTPIHYHAGVELSRLSLTRVGCVERLLWVQMLDLSHNELYSIAGIEALQLLVCLNLSYNRLTSFTALEPLKLLKSLKVLNVSSNEIGCHPVDTTRYLCASPLSHSSDAGDIMHELEKDCVKVVDYWEAILLFKKLAITQLDVSGNAICDQSFRELLPKVCPTLKWLDGACIR